MSSSKVTSNEKDVSLVNDLTRIAINCRKISRGEELNLIIPRLMNIINRFNEIQQDDHNFSFINQDVSVNELVIPKELSFLLIPLSIRIDPLDLKTKDIKVIPHYNVPKEVVIRTIISKDGDTHNVTSKVTDYLDSIEYKSDIDNFRRHFKLSGNDNLVKVMDVRKNVSLFDVLDNCCVVDNWNDLTSSRVHYFKDAFWPTFITKASVGGLLNDNYFNDTCNSIFSDYLINLSFG